MAYPGKRAWPKIRSRSKRVITNEEHVAIIASEQNRERRTFYQLLYETGAAQSDAANLKAEDIDWTNGVLVYRRKKLGPFIEPARLTIGRKLRELLLSLPTPAICFRASNKLLPTIAPPNFPGAAAFLEVRVSASIPTDTLGRNEQRPAVIRSGSPRKRWATAAALSTKRMPRSGRGLPGARCIRSRCSTESHPLRQGITLSPGNKTDGPEFFAIGLRSLAATGRLRRSISYGDTRRMLRSRLLCLRFLACQ